MPSLQPKISSRLHDCTSGKMRSGSIGMAPWNPGGGGDQDDVHDGDDGDDHNDDHDDDHGGDNGDDSAPPPLAS